MIKKTGKSKTSKAAKPMKDLPVKTLNAKAAKAVKGGTFSYGKVSVTYTPQKSDGSADP